MKTNKVNMTDNEQNDFFFWLGQDGETFELTKEEFDNQVEKAREKVNNWLEVLPVEEGYVD